jgi:hypothetical protein
VQALEFSCDQTEKERDALRAEVKRLRSSTYCEGECPHHAGTAAVALDYERRLAAAEKVVEAADELRHEALVDVRPSGGYATWDGESFVVSERALRKVFEALKKLAAYDAAKETNTP